MLRASWHGYLGQLAGSAVRLPQPAHSPLTPCFPVWVRSTARFTTFRCISRTRFFPYFLWVSWVFNVNKALDFAIPPLPPLCNSLVCISSFYQQYLHLPSSGLRSFARLSVGRYLGHKFPWYSWWEPVIRRVTLVLGLQGNSIKNVYILYTSLYKVWFIHE